METKKVTIPNPCNKGWNNMMPRDNGKYCDSCDKTVVDFTSMSHDQVKEYFLKNSGQKICGHFKATQVTIERPKLHKQLIKLYEHLEQTISINFLKIISLSLITLCMSIVGCQNTTDGEKAIKEDCKHSEQHLTGDTIYIDQNEDEMLEGEAGIEKTKQDSVSIKK